ncbi:MAG: O-antigen ligase family protein [candidate division NC10 bacterium]|nr:O-antigen ligase family protein [candidate division NC10 bacterium]
MANRSAEFLAGPIPLIALVLLLALGGGFIVAHTTAGLSLGAVLLITILFTSFLNSELALHIILLSMLLSPEIVVGGLGNISIGKPMEKGEALVLRMEDLVLMAVALAWFARTAIFKELGLIRKTPLNRAIFGYTISLILATLLGVFFGNVRPLRGFFYTMKYLEFFVVYFMAVNYVRDERQVRRLLATVLITCAISAVIGIAQIPTGERVAAPFEGKYGEPNTFGGYLVFMLALILAQALTAQGLPAPLGWAAFAGLLALPLLYTLSRSSWLAAIPMLLLLIALSRRRLILMVGLGALVVLGPLAFPKQVVDRYNYTLNAKVDRGEYRIGGARLDTSTSARFDSWRQGLQGWARRPLFGYGVTGFAFMDAQFVRVLVETGLVGLAAFMWLLWRTWHVAWDTHKRAAGTRFEGVTLGYLAGLVAMIIHALGANTFIIVRIMEPFWFMTGIITLLPQLEKSEVPPGTMTGSERVLTETRPR